MILRIEIILLNAINSKALLQGATQRISWEISAENRSLSWGKAGVGFLKFAKILDIDSIQASGSLFIGT